MTERHRRLKIALVDGCNLSCSHCYMGKMKETINSTKNIKMRIDEASELGVDILDFTGGEPTTHPDIIDLIDYAGKKNFGTMNLSTNGMSIGKNALFEAIKRNHVTCNISIDGATEETVDRIRGANVFKRLEKVFSLLKENNLRFSLRISLNKMNYRETEQIIDYASAWNVKVDLEPTQKIGNAIENSLLLEPEEKEFVANVIRRKKPDLGIDLEESFTEKIPCDGGFRDLLTINADDQAVSCLMISRSYDIKIPEERIPLADYWEKVQSMKAKMRVFKPEFPQCPTCENLHICQTGCHVTAHSKGCI